MSNATNKTKTHVDHWIPLMDYAMKTGTSLSTLRRHIKAEKIPFKVENGRYLLRADLPADEIVEADEIASLHAKLRKAQEEVAELKMLVAIYEEQTQADNHGPGNGKSGHLRMNG
jgi:hypothetical protein